MRFYLTVGIVAVSLLAACLLFFYSRQNGDGDLVLYGNVDIRQVEMGFRVNGRIESVFVDEGDAVHPGMKIAALDKTPFLDQIKQKEGDLFAKKASLEHAKILYDRRQKLVESRAVSVEDVDDAYSNLEVAKGELQRAEAALESARTDLKDAEICSLVEGFVLTRVLEPGSIAVSGNSVMNVSICQPVWIRAYVNEKNLGRIYPGMKGKIVTDTEGGKEYVGHIGFISPMAEFTPKTVETLELRTDLVYRIRFIVDNADLGLRQGMPVSVLLPIARN